MKGENVMKHKRIKRSLLLMMIILMSMALVFGCSKKTDGDEEQNTTLTLDEAQTITIGDDYEKIIVQASGVVIEDGTVDEIIIEQSVGDGDVTLNDIQGKLLNVQGGGTNSIYVQGTSSFDKVEVKREDGPVRVHADNTASIQLITIAEGSQDVILTGSFGLSTLFKTLFCRTLIFYIPQG